MQPFDQHLKPYQPTGEHILRSIRARDVIRARLCVKANANANANSNGSVNTIKTGEAQGGVLTLLDSPAIGFAVAEATVGRGE